MPTASRGLYEPFFSAWTDARRPGLGLFVVRSVVSRLRGRVEVESEAGRGSTFRITLPAAPAQR